MLTGHSNKIILRRSPAAHSRITERLIDSDLQQLYHPPEMGQRFRCLFIASLSLSLAIILLAGGCEQRRPRLTATKPTVASLVPAVTDLIVGMGAADHLLATCNYESKRPETEHLPRVGDYHSIDWEMLASLRPQVMITQLSDDKLPTGFRQRAEELNIHLVNIHINRLDDIFKAIETLGGAIGEPQKAAALEKKLRRQLDAVRDRVKGKPPVGALILLDEDAQGVVGPRNFMDDLLTLAGGENLAGAMGKDYPKIDREKLVEMNPQVVIQLLPEATPQVVAAANRYWERLPDVPAVKNKRVRIMTDWYILLPSSHIGELAEKFAEALHGD